jgi:uncharacterized RDD family membrane protein YckC
MTDSSGQGQPLPPPSRLSAMPSTEAEWRQAVNSAYRGVLGSRMFAYVVDIFFIFALTILFGVALIILGFLTFGFAWVLLAAIGPATAVVYSALTVGGPRQATYGMRIMNLKVVTVGGAAPGMLLAAVHALLFYMAAGTFILWLIDVAIGLMRRDKRLGHDLIVGVAIINADRGSA